MASTTQIGLKEPYYLRKNWGKIVFEKGWVSSTNGDREFKEIQSIDIPPYVAIDQRTPIKQIGITVLDQRENIPISIRFQKGDLQNGDYTAQLKVPEKWKGRYDENQIMGYLTNVIRNYFRKNGVNAI